MNPELQIVEVKYLDGHSSFHAQRKDGNGAWVDISPNHLGQISMTYAKQCIYDYLERHRAETVKTTQVHAFP